jgi:Polyketide cyclase / dehydrase and lipid transport
MHRMMDRAMRKIAFATGAAAAAAVGYRLVVSGKLTVDVGIGRRIQALGPIERVIAAPRETVFDVISSPYLGRTPRAMSDEIEVLERGSDMVLAAHHTAVGRGMVATTVETVRFDRPAQVSFRLLRGPVPHVVETFTLTESDGSTRLVYEGELGTDLGPLGSWWGKQVAAKWVATVDASLGRIAEEAERRQRVKR